MAKIGSDQIKKKMQNENFVSRRKLGELLIESGLLTNDKLKEALEVQKRTRKRLGEALIEMRLVSEEEIAFALAMQLKIAFIDLKDYPIKDGVIDSVPEEVCQKFVCIPVAMKNNILDVAMDDPLDLNMMKDLQFITGYSIQPAISTRSQIIDRLQRHYHPEKSITDVADQFVEDVGMEFLSEEKEEQKMEEDFESLKDSPFIKMVDLIIRNAIKQGASDIHIEAQENQVRVRNRIDGVLQDSIKLPKWTQPVIVSRIKVLAGLNIAERRLPQDGRIRVKARNMSVDLRVSTLPTYYGEKAVVRILNKQVAFLSLSQLGFSDKNMTILKNFIHRPQGMVLITGPTGSGKTSTLYACMQDIKSEEVNVISVEDPVEYELPGMNQVQINEKVGLTFPFLLRSILRQDPNVIMVGEIRDEETAEIAVQAAMTGHLVLSTLHTNDAPTAVTRLIDIGIPPYLIAASVVGVIAQRLVRTICPDCKEEYLPNRDLLTRVNLDQDDLPFKFYRGAGCKNCGDTGFKGRTALEEIMVMGPKIRELIQSSGTADTLREAAMAMGMSTLGMSGMKKIEMGITTIEEVLKAVHQKEELTTVCPHCGKNVSLDFLDCPYCEKPIIPTCSSCSRIAQPEWVVCPYCRNNLKPES
ncbi:MAG: Flp pilus assembly complex ATPase component TadA [Deltaproteobacteria bacterium]|nr:MAG: Flp pilus assembly complex ATPase component TadA [Deltaproteobacteria bacterium]